MRTARRSFLLGSGRGEPTDGVRRWEAVPKARKLSPTWDTPQRCTVSDFGQTLVTKAIHQGKSLILRRKESSTIEPECP